ncbi:MAG TPA: radical SAM protein [Candidatus Margulisiibacteriota bacterium]|nr:radical SAM protein [Candidatus Margulisiibacteriota bacterium]
MLSLWGAAQRATAMQGGTLPPPRFVFLEINRSCNLKCGHCFYWTENDDDRPDYLSGPRIQEVLSEFRDMNPAGKVVICGGEPMLDLETYFRVTRQCLLLELCCLSVVNGTRIRSEEMADRMILEGPDEISISLDSPDPAVHDRARGVPGSFAKAVAALRLLVAARRRQPRRQNRIFVMGLIFDESYRDLDRFYDLVLNDIGADKLKLNFLQPSFGGSDGGDAFFAAHHRVDPEELTRLIMACAAKYGLGLNPVWLQQVGMYFRSLNAGRQMQRGWWSPVRTREHICNTYERNIMIDRYGMARLCFSHAFRGMQLKHYGDLRRFWETSEDVRARMRGCNRLCGISHSVRRESSTRAATEASAGEVSPGPVSPQGTTSAIVRPCESM